MRRPIILFLISILLISACHTSRFSAVDNYVKQGDYRNAISTYLQMLEPHIREDKRIIAFDKEIISRIADVYLKMKNFEMAIQIGNLVIEKEPSYGHAIFVIGMAYEGLGDEENAIKSYRRAYRIPRSDPYRMICLSRINWVIRNDATRHIQTAIRDEDQINMNQIPDNSVAVFYFESLGDDPRWAPLQKGLAEIMVTDLNQAEDLYVAERMKLNNLMEELQIGVSNLKNESIADRAAKLLGVRTVVKGSYLILPDLRMAMDASIYDSHQIVRPVPVNFEGTLSRLFQMQKQLVLQIFEYFDITLSLDERSRILSLPTQNMDAFLEYCYGLDALDRFDFNSAMKRFKEAVRIDPQFDLARNQIIAPRVWDVTHNRNHVRVQSEVERLVQNVPRGGPDRWIEISEGLVTPWGRLQRLGLMQNAGFIPGNETRKSFQEADGHGARILPALLGPPPNPPDNGGE